MLRITVRPNKETLFISIYFNLFQWRPFTLFVQKLYELQVRLVWWVILPRYLTCRSFSLLRSANWQIHQTLHANYVILFKFRKWDCLWSERSVVYKAETPYKPELVPKQDRWPSPHWVSCGLRWFCAKLSTGMDLEVIKINFVI